MGERRRLTVEQALTWRERWSESDRRLISEQVERLGIVRFEAAPQETYLHGKDADGTTRMYVNPGYLEFVHGAAPEDAIVQGDAPPFLTLSTFTARSPGDVDASPQHRTCPDHPWLILPANGVCDDCA